MQVDSCSTEPLSKAPGSTDPCRSSSRLILLVDDDPKQLKLQRVCLSQAGFEVVVASSADEALVEARRRRPDAVVSDVIMGDVDGFGLCRMLRADETLATVPILLLSAHFGKKADSELATVVGASALVTRTPSYEAELVALRRALGEELVPAAPALDERVYELHLRATSKQLALMVAKARKAEEQYRVLFATTSDAVSILSVDGVILDANDRLADLLRVSMSALIGCSIAEFAPNDDGEAHLQRFRSAAARGASRDPSVSLRRPDGSRIYVDFSRTTVEIDGEQLVFAVGRDVTNAVEDARKLAEAEEKYRSLVENLPDVVWSCDSQATITFITANVERISGLSSQAILSGGVKRWLEHVHADDAPRVRAAFNALTTHSSQFDLEYRWQRPDGVPIWLWHRTTSPREGRGAGSFDGIISDVTAKKQLEESLRTSQKMEAMGQLTGGIAHDFNNILAVILANAHLLVDALPEGQDRDDASEIRGAAERAATLTHQLLAFSRKQALAPRVIELGDLVRGMEKMFRRLMGEELQLAVVPSRSRTPVRVDVGQIEQVLMNLVVNARDAMPKGGTLTIGVNPLDVGTRLEQGVESCPPGAYVVLTVADTGCGMDAETKRRMFEPFYTTKEIGKGTGLGLSTCYGIIEQSGGHIVVDSTLDLGTTMKIFLPRVDAALESESTAPPPAVKTGTETVLLVEDEAHVRASLRRMLESFGYQILAARDGREASVIATTHAGPIHVVLTDVVMPGMSGPDVVSMVRRHRRDAKAIYMSGYADHALFERSGSNGGVPFLQKPFSPETVARKLREILDA